MHVLQLIAVFLLLLSLGACAPETGSEAWCKDLREKPRGEWTIDEAADYAKHCIFRG